MLLFPVVKLILGIAALLTPIIAIALWYRGQPRTSGEWLRRDRPDGPIDNAFRFRLVGLAVASFIAFVIIGFSLIADAREALGF